MTTAQLVAEAERLVKLNREARAALAAAYGIKSK